MNLFASLLESRIKILQDKPLTNFARTSIYRAKPVKRRWWRGGQGAGWRCAVNVPQQGLEKTTGNCLISSYFDLYNMLLDNISISITNFLHDLLE